MPPEPALPPLAELAAELVDIASPSGEEGPLADRVQELLGGRDHLALDRDGAAVVARTRLGRPSRVLLAGHLDTVPVAGNLPSRREGRRLLGCGTADMKAAVAVMLTLAADAAGAGRDLTVVCYDQEEVEAERNGLGRLVRTRPGWLACDLAILMEPTAGLVEAGCQGTLRVAVTVPGTRAHTARAWLGVNAIHEAAPVLERLRAYRAREVTLDGCTYREGLSAVGIRGGVAGNVVPDSCTVTVNHRFAPDRTPQAALAHVREVFAPLPVELLDSAPGAPPGLSTASVAEFAARVGAPPRAKLGWTDVARFAALGVPALNYGPGDPDLAHTAGEWVDLDLVETSYRVLAGFLGLPGA